MKALTLGLLFIASSVIAQPQCTDLIYTGAPYSSLVTTGPNATALAALAGTVTLSAPLPPNAQNLAVTPVAWDFTVENPAIPDVLWTTPSTFVFSTDAKGNITNWSLNLTWGEAGGTPSFNMTVTSALAGDYVQFYQSGAVGPFSSITGTNATAGTWTCNPPPAPNQLAAEVTQLQAQVTSLQSQLQWQSYYHAYWEDAWVTTELALERAEAKK
jgi:hypothetical protein